MLHLHLHHLSALGAFAAIISSGHIIPLPEMVTLIFLGLAAAQGALGFIVLCLVAVAATLTTDLATYALCLGGSELVTRASQKIKSELVNRYSQAEEQHLFSLVFVSHFVPGWRFANPIIAGITQMPWRKFALYSFISSLVYAPLFVSLGFFFRSKIVPFARAIGSLHHFILLTLFIAVLTLLIVYNTRHAKE